MKKDRRKLTPQCYKSQNNKQMKVLFLLKTNSLYGSSSPTSKSGLLNSATITADELEKNGIAETKVAICRDGNSVDREVFIYKPDICVIEAIWVTAEKLAEVQRLHPKVSFVVRIHSEIPFLSNEGVAMSRILGYKKIPNVHVAFNSAETVRDFRKLYGSPYMLPYLPNIYTKIKLRDNKDMTLEKIRYIIARRQGRFQFGRKLDVGCFGAIRPLKNQLIQAVAAIHFADKHDVKLHFHMNTARIEQGGEPVLKNIRALFAESKHELVEHGWLPRKDFLKLLNKMDINLQVSFNESFNIVAADSIYVGTPVVVSETISWLPDLIKADVSDTASIVSKMEDTLRFRELMVVMSEIFLDRYNKEAIKRWREFLND